MTFLAATMQAAPVNIEHVLAYTAPPTILSLGTIVVAVINSRATKRNEQKLHSIDRAVNGVEPHEASLRENVESINKAVNGAAPGDDSIRENVQALVQRKDLDPEAP